MGTLSRSFTRIHMHADIAGATASTVCMVHCLLTPVAISVFPNVIRYLPGETWFHRLLAVTIVLFGVVGFVPGYLVHRRKALLGLIAVGMSLILVVAWSGERLDGRMEFALSVTGSALLVTAHLLNRSFCRQCRGCQATVDPCGSTGVR